MHLFAPTAEVLLRKVVKKNPKTLKPIFALEIFLFLANKDVIDNLCNISVK